MNAEAYIRQHIRKILLEQEKKKAKVRAVGIGRGRLKFAVTEQGALAKDDPAKLMKNLKVSGVTKGKNDVETLNNILESAVSGTEEMSEVFSDVKEISSAPTDKNPVEGVSVNVAVIPPRDGQKYIEYTVLGATNAFNIGWKKDVEVRRDGSQINVVFAQPRQKAPTKEEKEKEDNLLGEPDLSKEDEREEEGHHDEQNVVANIAGVTTPLGTGPSYPNDSKKAKKKKRKKKDDPDEDWYK